MTKERSAARRREKTDRPKLTTAARHSSASVEHNSPPEIVEAARVALGGRIDLDPASSAKGNAIVKADRFFTAEENGFTRPWFGTVWLNPPGGWCDPDGICLVRRKPEKGFFYPDGSRCTKPARAAAKAWWQKLEREHFEGRVSSAVFEGFSIEILQSTQVKPTGRVPIDFPMCFPTNRVAHLHENADGELVAGRQPPHASVLVYLPPSIDARIGVDFYEVARRIQVFGAAFGSIGGVVLPQGWIRQGGG